MLRLIIADDEKIIRENISNLIDWNSMGIELVAVCKNGMEAYEAVLDEYPDIVMTDIKMPGLSGLELISRIKEAYDGIEFIILSGYGEFNFATEAMKYGVKHYLLKPCNEEQIIKSINEVVEECYKKQAVQTREAKEKLLTTSLNENILRNIITESISCSCELDNIIKPYEYFLDFRNTNYELCYIYYLEEKNINKCMSVIFEYNKVYFDNNMYAVYVKNTLLIFFKGFQSTYIEFDDFIKKLTFKNEISSILYVRTSCENLKILLKTISEKLKRYGMIYFISKNNKIPLCNYNTLFKEIEESSNKLYSKNYKKRKDGLDEIKKIMNTINEPNFLKALISNILLKQPSHTNSCNTMTIAGFLLEMNSCENTNEICELLFSKITDFFPTNEEETKLKYKPFIEKMIFYLNDNLDNSNLTLKWLCENYLFMNVDYVSKQFMKQTGQKFSNYLNEARIQKAKELLLECGSEKIHNIAEQIGCGNNPQYFSQLFKKHTGITPSVYVKNFKTI